MEDLLATVSVFLAAHGVEVTQEFLRNFLVFVVAGAIVGYVVLRNRKGHKMPPGPPGNFFGNHAHLIPKEEPWKKFDEWHHLYGRFLLKRGEQRTQYSFDTS